MRTFYYNSASNNAYRDKHHNFFLEGKLELLDQQTNGFMIQHQRHFIYIQKMDKIQMENNKRKDSRLRHQY